MAPSASLGEALAAWARADEEPHPGGARLAGGLEGIESAFSLSPPQYSAVAPSPARSARPREPPSRGTAGGPAKRALFEEMRVSSEAAVASGHDALVARVASDLTDASASAGGETAGWALVSRRLEASGFRPLTLNYGGQCVGLPLGGTGGGLGVPSSAAARSALLDVLTAHEARGCAVEKITLEAGAGRSRAAAAEEAARRAEARHAELVKTAAGLERQLDDARGLLSRSRDSSTAGARDVEIRSLRARNQALGTAVRQREAEVQRLQERLQREVVDRDAVRRGRERALLAGTVPRLGSTSDSRAIELVSAYESARRNMETEIEFLRAEVRRLSSELAAASNAISRKDSPTGSNGWFSSDASHGGVADFLGGVRAVEDGDMLRRLADAKRAAESATAEARRQAGFGAAKLRSAHAALAEARAEAAEQRTRAETLQAELLALPPPRGAAAGREAALAGAEELHQAAALSSAVAAAAAAAAAGEEARATADLLRDELAGVAAALQRTTVRVHEAERRAAEAEAAKAAAASAGLDARSRAIVSEACRNLRLSDSSQLPSAVKKLTAALGVLPQMDRWVREVCALVTADASATANRPAVGGGVPPPLPPAKALAELRTWPAARRELHHLREFAAALSAQLTPRGSAAGVNNGPAAAVAGQERSPMTLGDVAAAVKRLIALEARRSAAPLPGGVTDHAGGGGTLGAGAESQAPAEAGPSPPHVGGRAAATAGASDASAAGGGESAELVVGHLMNLFDVSSPGGILPKANELHLFVKEQRTFLRAVRAAVGAAADAPPQAILQVMQQGKQASAVSAGMPSAAASGSTNEPGALAARSTAQSIAAELAAANALQPPVRPPPGRRPPPFGGAPSWLAPEDDAGGRPAAPLLGGSGGAEAPPMDAVDASMDGVNESVGVNASVDASICEMDASLGGVDSSLASGAPAAPHAPWADAPEATREAAAPAPATCVAAEAWASIAEELCGLLDVSSPHELVPKTEALLGDAHTLMRLLRVQHPDDLVPAARDLLLDVRTQGRALDASADIMASLCGLLQVASPDLLIPRITEVLRAQVAAAEPAGATPAAAAAATATTAGCAADADLSAVAEPTPAAPAVEPGACRLVAAAETPAAQHAYPGSFADAVPCGYATPTAAGAARCTPATDVSCAHGGAPDEAACGYFGPAGASGYFGSSCVTEAWCSSWSGTSTAGRSQMETTAEMVGQAEGADEALGKVQGAEEAVTHPTVTHPTAYSPMPAELVLSDAALLDARATSALLAAMPLLEKDFADYDDGEELLLDESDSDDSILGSRYDEELC